MLQNIQIIKALREHPRYFPLRRLTLETGFSADAEAFCFIAIQLTMLTSCQ